MAGRFEVQNLSGLRTMTIEGWPGRPDRKALIQAVAT